MGRLPVGGSEHASPFDCRWCAHTQARPVDEQGFQACLKGIVEKFGPAVWSLVARASFAIDGERAR